MFKIYIDERLMTIISSDQPLSDAEVSLKLSGDESKEELAGLIHSFEENILMKSMTLQTADPTKTWETFSSLYAVMEAAGGIVLNDEKNLLMIFRNDRWDLPKGKIEAGETRAVAAIREVTEETGLDKIMIDHACNATYHIYPFKEKKILKCTYWYKMHTSDKNPPKPQAEEGITRATWMNSGEVKDAVKRSYASIVNLLKTEGLITTN